jgi:hypothetical protein
MWFFFIVHDSSRRPVIFPVAVFVCAVDNARSFPNGDASADRLCLRVTDIPDAHYGKDMKDDRAPQAGCRRQIKQTSCLHSQDIPHARREWRYLAGEYPGPGGVCHGQGLSVYERCRIVLSVVPGLRPAPETGVVHHALMEAIQGKYSA